MKDRKQVMEKLEGAVAIVTGGASGIGFALAERFAIEKMKVVIADIEDRALEEAVAKLRATTPDVIGVKTDVADEAAVERLADETVKRFGKVNVLCNNAGVQRSAATWQLSAREWKWLLDVNLTGVANGVRAFVPRMLAQGDPCHVVNTASFGGLVTAPFMSAYTATKYAVVAISETMRAELHGTNVGVSVLCPAFVKTRLGDAERNRPAELDAGLSAEDVEVRRSIGKGASALVEGGVSTDVVVKCVLDALHRNRLYIITHPEQIGAFKKRSDAILRAAADAEALLADPTR
ncbi:MAG TPA: SDR family NAD(P)-dependent oxidoreductase [Polyangiaceae bacterium]|jgi:NAD(P)-dependent dehydrogenase (short-subunit alcohol dehydrogenase family)|nr:SDR family NAD(P)-dependent oxidoreductase [Polyangiaceae bacterium]